MATEQRSYAEIVRERIPHPIHSESEAETVRDEIQALVRTFPRSDGEDEYLSLLEALMLAWENGRYDVLATPGVDVVRSLLEDNDLKQADLVGPVFASAGIASEILSGKRKLNRNHILKLAEFFHTSPAIFLY